MTDYRFIGEHAEDLADGRTLVPGAVFSLDADALKDPFNKRIVDEGLCVELPKGVKPASVKRAETKQSKERAGAEGAAAADTMTVTAGAVVAENQEGAK